MCLLSRRGYYKAAYLVCMGCVYFLGVGIIKQLIWYVWGVSTFLAWVLYSSLSGMQEGVSLAKNRKTGMYRSTDLMQDA